MSSSDPYKSLVVPALISFVVALVFATVVAGLYIVQFHEMRFVTDPANWGVLGDYFGGTLGPIFNLVTIFLLVTSMRFQHLQLGEAKDDARIAKEQSKDEHKLIFTQSFEQTLFSWLHSYRDIVDGICFDRWTGRVALRTMWEIEMTSSAIGNVGGRAGLDTVPEIYKKVELLIASTVADPIDHIAVRAVVMGFNAMYEKHIDQLDIMFRTLYRLIKWVDRSTITEDEKFEYVGIIRSQVSAVELRFIFLNSLTARGSKFLPYLNKYAFLENMEINGGVLWALKLAGNGESTRLADGAFSSELCRKGNS